LWVHRPGCSLAHRFIIVPFRTPCTDRDCDVSYVATDEGQKELARLEFAQLERRGSEFYLDGRRLDAGDGLELLLDDQIVRVGWEWGGLADDPVRLVLDLVVARQEIPLYHHRDAWLRWPMKYDEAWSEECFEL
jgi:hypothetical protein